MASNNLGYPHIVICVNFLNIMLVIFFYNFYILIQTNTQKSSVQRVARCNYAFPNVISTLGHVWSNNSRIHYKCDQPTALQWTKPSDYINDFRLLLDTPVTNLVSLY